MAATTSSSNHLAAPPTNPTTSSHWRQRTSTTVSSADSTISSSSFPPVHSGVNPFATVPYVSFDRSFEAPSATSTSPHIVINIMPTSTITTPAASEIFPVEFDVNGNIPGKIISSNQDSLDPSRYNNNPLFIATIVTAITSVVFGIIIIALLRALYLSHVHQHGRPTKGSNDHDDESTPLEKNDTSLDPIRSASTKVSTKGPNHQYNIVDMKRSKTLELQRINYTRHNTLPWSVSSASTASPTATVAANDNSATDETIGRVSYESELASTLARNHTALYAPNSNYYRKAATPPSSGNMLNAIGDSLKRSWSRKFGKKVHEKNVDAATLVVPDDGNKKAKNGKTAPSPVGDVAPHLTYGLLLQQQQRLAMVGYGESPPPPSPRKDGHHGDLSISVKQAGENGDCRISKTDETLKSPSSDDTVGKRKTKSTVLRVNTKKRNDDQQQKNHAGNNPETLGRSGSNASAIYVPTSAVARLYAENSEVWVDTMERDRKVRLAVADTLNSTKRNNSDGSCKSKSNGQATITADSAMPITASNSRASLAVPHPLPNDQRVSKSSVITENRLGSFSYEHIRSVLLSLKAGEDSKDDNIVGGSNSASRSGSFSTIGASEESMTQRLKQAADGMITPTDKTPSQPTASNVTRPSPNRSSTIKTPTALSKASRRPSLSIVTTIDISPPRITTADSDFSGTSTAVAREKSCVDSAIGSGSDVSSSSSLYFNMVASAAASRRPSSVSTTRSNTSTSTVSSLATATTAYSGAGKQPRSRLHAAAYETNNSPRRSAPGSPIHSGIVPPFNSPLSGVHGLWRLNSHSNGIISTATSIDSPTKNSMVVTNLTPKNPTIHKLISPVPHRGNSLDLSRNVRKSTSPQPPLAGGNHSNLTSSGTGGLAEGVRRQLMAWSMSTTSTASLLHDFVHTVAGNSSHQSEPQKQQEAGSSFWLDEQDSSAEKNRASAKTHVSSSSGDSESSMYSSL
ncbi:hypothetical protein SeLEV6574_g03285 [Synchytrium endobioticum]|uniref:Uncharacterized protein n=1 Tax=Synchytrium endobioticum TaxID=286115 RepID=A0A507D4S0_9FUNG|nr:hypothetical protein SeLEV6574_g03285 [Synchytrium endobioticum]